MARPKLELGERGTADAVPQRKVDGKWRQLRPEEKPRLAERWRARAYYRGFDGVRGEESAYGRTKRLALANLSDKLDQALTLVDTTMTVNTPLSTACELWLTQIRRTDSGLSPNTIKLYEGNVTRYLLGPDSSIRGLTLGQVNMPSRVRTFLQSLAETSGDGAAKSAKTTLSNVLNFAINDGALLMNATLNVRPVRSQDPKPSRHDNTRALTPSERQAVMDFAYQRADLKDGDPRSIRKREALADLVALMSGSGFRIGEAREVRWEDLNLEGGFIRLRGTKSKAARRRIDLPPWLIARLEERIKRMSQHYLDAASHAKSSAGQTREQRIAELRRFSEECGVRGYVISSPARLDPDRKWDQSNSSNAMRQILDDAGFTWARGHTFRRTAISMLHEGGAKLAKIADFAGHADPSMTASVYLARDFEGDKSDLAAML